MDWLPQPPPNARPLTLDIRAVDHATDGMSYRACGARLGLDPSTVRRVALGIISGDRLGPDVVAQIVELTRCDE